MADKVENPMGESGTLGQELEKLDSDKRSKFAEWLQETFGAENYAAIRESRLSLSQEQLTSLREQASQDYMKIIFDSLETSLEIYKNAKLTPKLFKSHLEMISRFEEGKKQFFLSALLSKLNEAGYGVSGVDSNGRVTLRAPSGAFVKDGSNELEAYTNHLNNFVKENGKGLLFQALLYKTTGLEDFKSETNKDKLSLNNYAIRLLKKHVGLEVKGPKGETLTTEQIIQHLGTKRTQNTPKETLATTDEDFNKIKETLIEAITNPADKDFLRVYFDTLRQEGPKGKMVTNTDTIQKFDQNRADMLKEFQSFDEKTLAQMGIKSKNQYENMMRTLASDPSEGIVQIANQGGAVGILVGLLWGIFGGKDGFSFKRFFMGLVGGTAIGAMPINELFKLGGDAFDFTGDKVGKGWEGAKKLYLGRAQTRQETNKGIIGEITKGFTPEQQAEYSKFSTMLLGNPELSDKSASDIKKALENGGLPAIFKDIKTPFFYQEGNSAGVEEAVGNMLENAMSLKTPKSDNGSPKTELTGEDFYNQNVSKIGELLTKIFASKDAPKTGESLGQFLDKGINVAKADNPTSVASSADLSPIVPSVDLSPIK